MILGDGLVSVASLAIVVLIRRNIELGFTRSLIPRENFELSAENCAIFAAAMIVGLAMSDFYNQRVAHRHRFAIGIAAVIQVALIAIVWTLLAEPLPRSIVFGMLLFEIPGIVLWRRLLRLVHVSGTPPLVLVGSASGIEDFFANLATARNPAPEIAGVIAPSRPAVDGIPYWGRLDDEGMTARIAEAEELLFVSDDESASQRLRVFAARGARGFLLLPSAADALALSSDFAWLNDQPLVEIAVPFGYGASAVAKRTFDLVLASLLAVLFMPVWLAATVVIFLDSGRPVLIRQPRVGRGGVTFRMWKFRTMRYDANGDTSRLAERSDTRVTRSGALLRRYRLDELPQLINVLAGEMSLVGPRPEQSAVAEGILRQIPEFGLRTMVRPGIAGLAQVSADYHTSAAVKLRYDIAYMRDWSLWLDVRILAQTVSTVLSGRGV